MDIWKEIIQERDRQKQKWGDHYDDQHTPWDWHGMIADYNNWARRMARKRYIQIAALAVAAVEAIDRQS